MLKIIQKALEFATEAHSGQIRKYTGEPYINHPIAVCELVKKADHYNDYMLAAALLHDTVEDTDVTIDDIRNEFGGITAIFVGGLTDVSKPGDGNRATRKEIDRQHLKVGLPPIQTIKCADLIDNSKSILEHDERFAKTYMEEKRLLLDVLIYADPILRNEALKIVSDYYQRS